MQKIRTFHRICHRLTSEMVLAAIISMGTMVAVLLMAIESEKPAVLPVCRNPLEISNSDGDVAVVCDPTTEHLSQAYESLNLDSCSPSLFLTQEFERSLPPRVFIGSDCVVHSMDCLSGETSVMFGLPVDVNRATVDDLQAIRGIGPALASRIVELRQARGFYRQESDLEAVRGIGPVMSRRFSRWLHFSGERPSSASIERGTEESSGVSPGS